jgi:hypothetical protein
MTGCTGIEEKMTLPQYEVPVQHLLGAVFLKLISPWNPFGLEIYRQDPRRIGKNIQQNEVYQIFITKKLVQVMLTPTSDFHDLLPPCLWRVT